MRATFITAMCLGGNPAANLLLLCCPGPGNVPMRHLFDRRVFHKVVLALEPETGEPGGEDAAGLAGRLPPYDICFNAVADPDLAASFLDDIGALIGVLDRPVLNPLDRVAAARRDLAPSLHADIPGLIVPAVARVDADEIKRRAAEDDFPSPLIMRPAGMHGGDDLVLLQTQTAFREKAEQTASGSYYLTDYVDYRSADGFFRKYRLVFIDRQVFPYHLAVSREWKVHYWRTAEEMSEQQWMQAEEEAFLADWRRVFGAAADAVEEIGRRLDLDYAGLDCGLMPDGRLVLFEANAQMLVHLSDPPELFPYKHRYLPALFQAVDRMVLERSAAAPPRPEAAEDEEEEGSA